MPGPLSAVPGSSCSSWGSRRSRSRRRAGAAGRPPLPPRLAWPIGLLAPALLAALVAINTFGADRALSSTPACWASPPPPSRSGASAPVLGGHLAAAVVDRRRARASPGRPCGCAARDPLPRPRPVRRPCSPGPGNAITDVDGVNVGVTTLIDGDGPLVGPGPGPHRRHGDRAARRHRREPVVRRLPPAQRQRRAHRPGVDPRVRPAHHADRDHEHAQRRRRPRRDRRRRRAGAAPDVSVLEPAGRRRDLRRRAERHQRVPRQPGAPVRRRWSPRRPARCPRATSAAAPA